MQLKNLIYFSRGKRSRVYTTTYKKRRIIVKYSSRALIEAKWLKNLRSLDFVPRLISAKKGELVYFFIEGISISDYIKKNKNPRPILRQILKQCYELDKLKINKLELTNPYKHILIKNKKAKMIDFERCYKTNNPKNVTQFCEYLMRIKMIDRKSFIKELKKYKKSKTKTNFDKILSFL